MRIVPFLSYHNAVPIGFSIMLLGAGGVFAATNPEAIYSSVTEVISIDNSYIAQKDLASYSPRVQIDSVTEDSEFYYVAYTFYTIDLADGAWQDVAKAEVLQVSKEDLGEYRDLGLYVTEQLKQKTDRELAYLIEVQGIERQSVTAKVVATEYGGLVGKLLDTRTEQLPGYTPIITPPPVVAAVTSAIESEPPATPTTPTTPSAEPQPSTSAGNPSLKLQVLGNNPSEIAVGTRYSDLGAVASDAKNSNIRLKLFLNGTNVEHINIDTSVPGRHDVQYIAIDPDNNSVVANRVVIVFDPNAAPEGETEAGVDPESTASSTPSEGATDAVPTGDGIEDAATSTPETESPPAEDPVEEESVTTPEPETPPMDEPTAPSETPATP